MTLLVALIAGAGMLVFGLGAAALRRSLVGMLVGIELGVGGLIMLVTALWNLTGTESSTGQVIAVALVAFGVSAAVLVTALQLAAARARNRAKDLEPW